MSTLDVRHIFESLKDTELQQESFPESMSWDEFVRATAEVSQDDKKLKEILTIKRQEEAIEQVSLDRIMTSNFQSAKEVIDQMTLAKRIEMLEEVSTYRDYLYECIDRYGKEGLAKDEQLTASEFRILMGRLKHLEIVQNWLYGIL